MFHVRGVLGNFFREGALQSIVISSRSFSSDTRLEKIVRNQETKMQVLCIKREKEREKEKRKGKKEAEKH